MANGFNTSPYILPNMFSSPGAALQQGLAMQERRNERQADIDFRNQRLKEADDWKKLQLIQELTDVDKYQTGEAIADALGNIKASELLQKYTAAAGSMTPAELQARISHDIQNTTVGMQAMKDELILANKTLADLKTRFPSLDTKALDRYYREDVINRRIENSEFKNPIHVNPTNMRFDDPDFLAAFVSGDKAIRDEIVNPKLVEKDVQVGMGSPASYTAVGGDIPFFRERNFNPDTDIVKGFLKKGIDPHMKLKSSVEKINGQDVEVLRPETFDVFSENAKLEFNAKAAQRFPNFYSLSKAERNKLTRQIALEDIKALDQSDFSFKSATKPPSTNIRNYIGSGADLNINDIYREIENEAKKHDGGKTPLTILSTEAQKAILDQARGVNESGLTQKDIWVQNNPNGGFDIMRLTDEDKRTGEKIGTLTYKGVNITKQPGIAEKREVIDRSKTAPKPKQKTYKGLDKNGNPIFE